ncbi:MAG: permease prefix domain 1-containing protein, partial [Firmicutes bacterium]|nr:permease prefix domain 1-containing protein [Bacillota bacterium]
MDAIETYLDNVFAAFPQNKRVLALKKEMLANMEEKYHALKQQGKSENEAVGTVISDFGSIDEIAAELGVGHVSEAGTRSENFAYGDKAEDGGSVDVTKAVARICWPLVTAAYLLWSFLGNAWDISWVIWPVAGVLFAAVAAAVKGVRH